MIKYIVSSLSPQSHIFNVQMVIPNPDPTGQKISLPNWIPGSYFIRDFSRHIVSIKANCPIKKINSNTWDCEKINGPLTLDYSIYAFDLSVRGAYCDEYRAFFNGSSLFLMAHGQALEKCKIEINVPNCPLANKWRVATTLRRDNADEWGFGSYIADSYEELIDHPVEIGDFTIKNFDLQGIEHTIVISGKHDGDTDRLAKDVSKICESHINLFKEKPPFERYLFILTVTKDGYGGLEHRNASALIIPRDCLPLRDEKGVSRGYMSLLGLFSHEYFHAWNVKRIKPECFIPYDLNEKSYTEQLWAFEGITSYYDDLALLRSKVISVDQYLNHLAESITKLLRTPGRKVQSITESSFDAWIKFYQPNENAVNSQVSYYLKGSLIALACDLLLRGETEYSLDDIMRILWQEYGKKGIGVPEGKIEELLKKHGSEEFSDFIQQALFSIDDIPFEKIFSAFGLQITYRQAQSGDDMGGKLSQPIAPQVSGNLGIMTTKNQGRVFITTVLENGAACKAGLSAQDEIIAINDIKVDADSFDKILKRLKAQQTIIMHIFRQDIIKEKTVTLNAPENDTVEICILDNINEEQKKRLNQWLLL